MNQTTNLGLNMPQDDDPIDISAVNQNFQKLDDEVNIAKAQVGDVLFTYRKDLGDDWVECNGQPFDPELYPELAVKCPGYEKGYLLSYSTETITNIHANKQQYGPTFATDGVYDVIIVNEASSSSYKYTMRFSKDNFKTYGTSQIVDSSLSTGRPLNVGPIFYVNGYWICVLRNEYSNTSYLTSTVAFSSIENPVYTVRKTIESIKIMYVYDIIYENEKYYMICKASTTDTYPIILISDSPDFNTFTTMSLLQPAISVSNMYWHYAKNGSQLILLCTSVGSIRAIYATNNIASGFSQKFFDADEFPIKLASHNYYNIICRDSVFGLLSDKNRNSSIIVSIAFGSTVEEILSGNYTISEYSIPNGSLYDAYPNVWASHKQFVFAPIKFTDPTEYGIITGSNPFDTSTWKTYRLATENTIPYPKFCKIYRNHKGAVTIVNSSVIFYNEYFIPKITTDNAYVLIKVK